MRLNVECVLPAIQRSLADAGDLGEPRACHPVMFPDASNLARRQHAEVFAERGMFQFLAHFIEILDVAGVAAAHRQVYGQLDGGLSSSIAVCMAMHNGLDIITAT